MTAQLPGIVQSLAIVGPVARFVDGLRKVNSSVAGQPAAVAVVVAAVLVRWARRRRSPNIGSSTCQRSNASNSRCW